MKNLFFAAITALTLFASCSKHNDEIAEPADGSIANISFVEETSQTRAFFSTTAAAETWEKILSYATVYVFNSSGSLVVQRTFTYSEILAKELSFVLPGVISGSSCDFYVVANLAPSVTSKSSLLAVLETSAAMYNGTFANVSTASKRIEGFVMSGYTTKAVAVAGATTDVSVTLKRTVAKVAIETSVSPSFNSLYTGAIKVNSIAISKSASQSPIIKPATAAPGTMNFSTTQTSNAASDRYQNLFYLFENGNLHAGSRVLATISATYDLDGNFLTTADQSAMSYEVELSGTSAGVLIRNGYYRVAVTINGLSGSDATLSVIVADWESPVTQTVNVGN